jgi:hypothetical protein
MTVKVEAKNIYGAELFYVVDDVLRTIFTDITKKKTLDRSDIASFKVLGLDFELKSIAKL